MKKRGRGVLKGAVGYPGPKQVTTQNFTEGVVDDLKVNETRLGVSKTALTIFSIRQTGLSERSLTEIEADIEAAAEELKAAKVTARSRRWKPALAK